ncbi:MAG: dihydroorotase [Planctomycetota bacterium]
MAGDLLLRGGTLVRASGVSKADLLIRDGKVAAIAPSMDVAAGARERGVPALGARESDVPVLDVSGHLLFPGLVDPQVHFREPGGEHKEDLASGSLAAVAGGVTSYCEMPNTRPATTTKELLEDKLARAKGRSWADHAFFVGATAANAERLAELERLPGCAGVKVFMGSSTGDLLIPDDRTLERVLRSGERRVAVHAEDEERLRARYAALGERPSVSAHPDVRDVQCALRAARRLLDLAEKTRRRVHLLHVSTEEEVHLLRDRDLGDLVTAEVTPNHLFLAAPDCYASHGTLVQMNPPLRGARHRDALRQGLADGVLTCVGSDHAPHALSEKHEVYPRSPSGIPGVQTTLGLLLLAVRDGWLRLEDVPRVSSLGPAMVYGIQGKGDLAVGRDGDVAVVDPSRRGPLPLEWLRSRAGYSPYVGWALSGWPVLSVLRGTVVFRHGNPVGDPIGRPLAFG